MESTWRKLYFIYVRYSNADNDLISGDNLDRHVAARHAGLDKKDHEIHMYHCYAKPIEIVPKQYTKNVPKIPIEDLTPEDIIPNVKNYDQLKKTFAIIGLRILTKRLPELQNYKKHIIKHIPHKYSNDMKQPSVIVSNSLIRVYLVSIV